MKPLSLLTMLAGVLVHQVALASVPDVSLRVIPERDLVHRGGNREVIVQIDLDGKKPETGRRTPMNLAIVLDRSGSMEGAKMEKARQAACIALDQLGPDDYFSLVVYDNEAQVIIEPMKVRDGELRDDLKRRINRITPGGSTGLYAGVQLGAKQLRQHLDREFVNRVILMSDGIANSGPSRTSDLVSLGRELRSSGIAVSTIGLGDDYNEDLMTALAEASHANYYYVQDAEKLPGIFSEELGVARSMIARGMTIRITVPGGVSLKEIVGRPEIECRNNQAVITLPEYFGGEKRRFLARCIVDAAKDSAEKLEVAAVALEYLQADGKKADNQSQVTNIILTDAPEKADASVRVEVAREVSIYKNRIAKEEAVKLADEGKPAEAIERLQRQKAAISAAPAATSVPNRDAENASLDSLLSDLQTEGKLKKDSRKKAQFENWQDKNQKR